MFFSSSRGSFLVFSARGTQGARPNITVQVWALTEVRGTCSGVSKSQVTTGRHSEHVEPSRPIQTEVQVYKNVRRVAHVVQNSADGTQWLPAHLALMLECSCSCSSAPRAHARVLVAVLSCLCSCSTARRRRVRVVLVLECSLFGVLTMMSHTGQAHVIQPPKSIVWTIPITRQSPHA